MKKILSALLLALGLLAAAGTQTRTAAAQNKLHGLLAEDR